MTPADEKEFIIVCMYNNGVQHFLFQKHFHHFTKHMQMSDTSSLKSLFYAQIYDTLQGLKLLQM